MIFAEIPGAPTREEWQFVEELKQKPQYHFKWNNVQPQANTLDARTGLELKSSFPDPEKLLETAYADWNDFLRQGGIPASGKVVATRLDSELKTETYKITVGPDGVEICAADTEGVRRAIFHLEEQLLQSPFLAFGVTQKEPWVKNRISRCFFGPIKRPPFNRDELMDEIDYYPDEYLNRLAHEGINGLWLTIVWRDLCKTSFTELAPDAEQRLAKLRRTVDKCRRYGIKTWAFCIEPRRLLMDEPLLKDHPEFGGVFLNGEYSFCPDTEAARQYIYESVNWLFSQVPGLGGMLNITHGERYTTCLSSVSAIMDHEVNCPRCSKVPKWQILHNSLSAMHRGMKDAAPAAELISWLYMPQPAQHGEWVFELGAHTPEGVILQYNFESNGKKKQLDKFRCGGDYWLSYTGPCDDFARVAQAAVTAGTPVSAKIQVGCSHEVATIPFVPVPGLLYRKYRAMRRHGVEHVMQCWYFGNYPGIMNRAAGALAYEGFADSEDEFLFRLACPEWGGHAADAARAWKEFSDAYANYPLANMVQYYGPMHAGPVWPLYLRPEMKPLAPTWKPDFPPSGDVIGETLENHSLHEALLLTGRMAEGWNRGVEILKRIAPDFAGNRDRLLDIGVAEALGIQFSSARNIYRYYLLRRQYLFENRKEVLVEMKALVLSEIDNSMRLKELCLADSRLGFHSEAESHLYYPALLDWRAGQLRELLANDFAAAEKGETCPLALDAPAYKIGSGTVEMPDFRWSAEWQEENLVVRVECPGRAECFQDAVSLDMLDIAGAVFPWLINVCSDGSVIDNRNAAEVKTSSDGDSWCTEIKLPGLFWSENPLERPFYFKVRRTRFYFDATEQVCVWPGDKPEPRPRLNLGYFSGETMGKLEC